MLSLVSLLLLASGPRSLAALQAEARQVNPSLRAARMRQAALLERSRAQGTLGGPELEATVWRPPLDQPWNLYEAEMVMVSLRQRFPALAALAARREAEEAGSAAEGLRGELAALELDRQVALAWVELVSARLRHDAHTSHLEVLARVAELARSRVTSGGRLDDVAQAEREQARLAADVVAEAAAHTRAALVLGALLARPLGEVVEAEVTPAQTVTVAPEALVATARAARPETRLAELLVRQQRAAEGAARAEAVVPAVSVGLSYFPPLRVAPSHGLGLTLGMELPWLWGGRAAGAAGEGQLAHAVAEEARDVAYRIDVEVRTAHAMVAEATRRLEALRAMARPPTLRAAETALAGYRSGQLDVMVVLSSQRAIIELDVAEVEARVLLLRALVELDRAVGGVAPRTEVLR